MNTDCNQRLDRADARFRTRLLPHCRLQPGQVWHDPGRGHVVGCGDATDPEFIDHLCADHRPTLAVHDPPYNLLMGEKLPPEQFAAWCQRWIDTTHAHLTADSSLYIWLGADQNDHFQPLPQVMAMMAQTAFASRAFITLRNQRGYGTSKNWMAVRQELLYYTLGEPSFDVQYTAIPKILRGYYKKVKGEVTENIQRSHSENIRSSNVWVDIQQVFYRQEENINGCFAQKPLKAIERIVAASSIVDDTVLDFFAHAGTTLLACERLQRRCLTCDIDPIFAEITIRRLEHYRATGKTGWQRGHPFETELAPLTQAV